MRVTWRGQIDAPIAALDACGHMPMKDHCVRIAEPLLVPLMVDGIELARVSPYRQDCMLRVRTLAGRVPWRYRRRLRRSALSGRWDRFGAQMWLVDVTAVDSPGFPVPGARARNPWSVP